jgi:fumarate reductase flavoprotein subunit
MGMSAKEISVDVCVVGGAGSGLSAAISAAQHGVRNILVLEKMKTTGGCTKMSAGMMAIDSPTQRRFGYHYSVDDAFRDLIKIHNWNCDAMLVRKWLAGSGENISWLEDLGLTYDFVTTESCDQSKFRNTHHRFGDWDGQKWIMKHQGPILVKCLMDACEKNGVRIITETRARHLIKNEKGAVVGVKAEGPEGPLTVHAGAVVLGTGSISSNQDLIKRFYGTGEYKDIRIMAQVPHNTGDGLILAEEIGAAAGRIGALFIGPHNHYPGASELVGMLMRRPQPVKVNMYGERFVDESIPITEEFGWMQCLSVDNQPGKKCFIIMDQGYINDVMAGRDNLPYRRDNSSMIDSPPRMGGSLPPDEGKDPAAWRERVIDHVKYEEKAGRAKICQTLDEVAAFIGCKPDILKASLERYNLFCARGYDGDFLKDPRYLAPVRIPPYYVLLGRSGIDTCLGGLKIDNHQHVMNTDGGIIPGLYAAGVMCSGWNASAYCFFGSEMSFTIWSGRNAGSEASEYLKLNG